MQEGSDVETLLKKLVWLAVAAEANFRNKRARGVPKSAADLWWASAYVRSYP